VTNTLTATTVNHSLRVTPLEKKLVLRAPVTHTLRVSNDGGSLKVKSPVLHKLVIKQVGLRGLPGTGQGSSYPNPDILDESDATYFYFGWESINDGWLVERQVRSTSQRRRATISANPDNLTFSSAWLDRASLSYD